MTEFDNRATQQPAFFVSREPINRPKIRESAVFIRTHKWDAKVENLFTRLRAACTNYDLYILYDVTKAAAPADTFSRLDIPPEQVIRVSEKLCAEIGFYKGPGLVFYHCGDIALCYAMRVVPEYKFYAMIDWDLHFTADNDDMLDTFFQILSSETDAADYVGLKVHHCTWGMWYESAKKIFRDDHCYYSYFPFIVLSRRLLALVYAERQLHEITQPQGLDLVNGEMFVPSLAVAAGFKVCDLKQYLPQAYDGSTIAMNTDEYGVGLPLDAAKLVSEDKCMIHPIYTAAEFVDRVRGKFLKPDASNIERLREHLDRPEWSVVPAAMREDIEIAINSKVSAPIHTPSVESSSVSLGFDLGSVGIETTAGEISSVMSMPTAQQPRGNDRSIYPKESFNREENQTVPTIRANVIKKLWRGNDPLQAFPTKLYEHDMQGWQSHHPYLTQAIDDAKPKIIVEIGVWKGGSTIHMAKHLKNLGLDAVVIAVDTWLGAWDHWIHDDFFTELGFIQGYPNFSQKFYGNVVREGVGEYVVPLPLDSLNAVHVLRHFAIKPDIVHIDGGHDYRAVMSDLTEWWPQLSDGGILIGDDYRTDGGWPGVKKAFDEFFGGQGFSPIEHHSRKCIIRKPKV